MLPTFEPLRAGLVAMEVAAAPRASKATLAQWQRRRLSALLGAASRSSLYRPWLQDRDPEQVPLSALPIFAKSTLMARFDEWVTHPEVRLDGLRAFVADPSRIAQPFLGRYVAWESSGSSGEPGVFVQDPGAMAVYDAIEALRRPAPQAVRRLFDPFGLTDRMVFVGATNGHFASTVSVERLRRLNPVLAPTLRQVSFLQPLARMLAQLQALSPTSLATYPSVALLLAEQQRQGQLAIQPREIWTGGETLTPPMRQAIGQAFQCPVLNTYGSSEFLSLAFECRHGRLHLNSDWAILESVDGQGRAVPPGQPGATSLLTNLANHVQPIIRYDIGDSVTVHETPCACGSVLPVIEVMGRDEDLLHLAGPRGRKVDVTPMALSTVLESDAGLYDFQLVQQGPRALLLRTSRRGKDAQVALRHGQQVLADFLAGQGAPQVQIACQSGAAPRRGRSGKVKRVIALAA